jgi:branched-chain amino acid aminotransferase
VAEHLASNQPIGFFSGQWIDQHHIALPIDDLGWVQGVTAVERLRTYGGKWWMLDRHLQRLDQTITGLGLPPLDYSTYSDRLDEFLQRNGPYLRSQGGGQPVDVGVALLVTPGTKPGGKITEIIHLYPLDPTRYQSLHRDGERLVISGVTQPPTSSWSPQLKVRSRLHYYLADLAVSKQDPQAAAVLVDLNGSLLETSRANLAIIRGDRFIIPPLTAVLGGVSLSVVAEWAESIGLTIQRMPIARHLALDANECILTGTGPLVWSAISIDGQPIANGQPGPICQQLIAKIPASI